MKISLYLFLQILPLIVCAQSQSFTIAELSEGFTQQFVENAPSASTDGMDLLYCSRINSFDKKEYGFICSNPSLHKAGDIVLPVSEFAYLDESGEMYAKYALYWIEPREHTDSKSNARLISTMRKRYGYVEIDDTTVLIPAKWFSGDLKFLQDPFVYGNQVVSNRLCLTTLSNGEYHADSETAPAYSSRWKAGGELERNIYRLASMIGNGKSILPPNLSDNLKKERAFKLFGMELGRYIDKKLLPQDYRSREFNVMLRLDESLKAHLFPLDGNEQLTTEDRLALTVLGTAVKQMPSGLFSGYWCERGLYPAIFLKIQLSERADCSVTAY